ncbi:MAG: hypothetical protein FWD71_13320 [Oscillospiraceae bacterium]|nr:hypothetical protein [Oscillospiraceae bacterium]
MNNTVYREFGEGWYELFEQMLVELQPYDINIIQAKEKYGSLRVYYSGQYDKEIDKIIEKYEKLSMTICEECGKSGNLRTDLSWNQTLCNECYNKVTLK